MTRDSALMTVGEVARYLQLHRDGVRWLAKQNLVRSDRTVGGQYLFRFGDVKALALTRAASRMTPAQRVARVRRPEGQFPLPLLAAAAVAKKPLTWWGARFRPRMVRATLDSSKKAKQSLSDRGVNQRQKGGRSKRVA